MTSDLHAQLRDLAADAPAAAPDVPPADLWRAGKRRQRRRTAAGVVAACAIVLAGVGGAGLVLPPRDAFPEPTASKPVPALPDELHAPPRWLESNDDDPAGPFAVMWMSQEQRSSDSTSYIGVSAVTGEYRRVEIPGIADAGFMDDGAVLSPSGRYIAYWATSADRSDDPDGLSANLPGRPGVYDTVAGRDLDVEWDLADDAEAPYGLNAWDLRWVDDTRVYLQVGAIMGAPGTEDASGSRALGAGWVVDVAEGGLPRLLAVPGMARTGDVLAGDGAGHLVVRAKGKGAGYLFFDPARPALAQNVKVAIPGDGGTGGSLGVSGVGRVAMATQSSDGEAVLAVSEVAGPGKLFPAVRAHDVFGWSDRQHVVVSVAGGPGQGPGIVKVDVATGDAEPFIGWPSDGGINPPQIASGLLDTPPVDRGDPDWPTDPRIFVAFGIGTLLLLVVALRIWRRRERG